jgi:hypothetical protein
VGIVRVHDTARVIGGQLATIQSVLLHLRIKQLPMDAEALGSVGPVAFGFAQRARNHKALQARERSRKIAPRPILRRNLLLMRAIAGKKFEIGGANRAATAEDRHPFDGILKFADIAWPGICEKVRSRIAIQPLHWFGCLPQKIFGERHDVGNALAQRD